MSSVSTQHAPARPGAVLQPVAGDRSWNEPALSLRPGLNPGDGSLLELWHGLKQGRKTILLLALTGGLAGLAVAWMQAPVYRATAAIEVQGFNDDFLNLRSVQPTMASSGPLFRSDIP